MSLGIACENAPIGIRENIKTKGLLFKVPIQGKETLFPVIIIALHPFKNLY